MDELRAEFRTYLDDKRRNVALVAVDLFDWVIRQRRFIKKRSEKDLRYPTIGTILKATGLAFALMVLVFAPLLIELEGIGKKLMLAAVETNIQQMGDSFGADQKKLYRERVAKNINAQTRRADPEISTTLGNEFVKPSLNTFGLFQKASIRKDSEGRSLPAVYFFYPGIHFVFDNASLSDFGRKNVLLLGSILVGMLTYFVLHMLAYFMGKRVQPLLTVRVVVAESLYLMILVTAVFYGLVISMFINLPDIGDTILPKDFVSLRSFSESLAFATIGIACLLSAFFVFRVAVSCWTLLGFNALITGLVTGVSIAVMIVALPFAFAGMVYVVLVSGDWLTFVIGLT